MNDPAPGFRAKAATKDSTPRGRAAARARAALPYLAMVVGGLLLRGAFAPFEGQASVAFFAPIPLFLASRLCAPRRAAALGFAWGFAFFASALAWFVPLVKNGGPWPIVLLGEIGLSAWCALFPALAAAALSRLRAPWRGLRETARAAHARMVAADPGSDEEDEAADELAALRRRSLAWEMAGPVAAGLVWAGAETLRARIGGGFAWYSLGASQRAFPALAQLAAAGGVALVSAVVAVLADALAGVALRAWDTIRHTPGSTRRHLDLTVALVALLAAFLWGSRHAREAQRLERGADRTLLVAAVNPRMPCIFSDDDAAAREAQDRLVNLSALAAQMRPDLVAWPETTLPDVLPSPRLEADMRDLAGMLGAPILAGSTELPPGETLRAASLVWNSAWIFSPKGVSEPYRKRHLVPFGEFVPLDETIPALRRLSPAGVSCAAGAGPVRLPVARRGADDAALVSPLICFEDTVPATARESARGADLLLSISNDAWFEGTCESAQHHVEAAFRAIENGLPLVRVSNHGATGVVLPSGEATPDATGGFLVHAVPLLPRGRAPTPYARFGDWLFGFPCALLALLAAFLPARLRPRPRSPAAVLLLALAAAGARADAPPPEPCFRRPDVPVASLDPALAGDMASARAASLVWETPLQFDYAARPYRLLPYAAEAMPEVSEDGLEITLRLRDDVRFGPADCFDTPDRRRRATAEDLVYSLKRIADAKVSSSGYWLLEGKVEGIEAFRAASLDPGPTDYSLDVPGLRALDDRTVRIRLTRPDPQFLWALAMPYAALVPREAVEHWGPLFGSHEAGSGPFALASWRRGHRMLFVRRPGRDTARDRTPPPEPGEPAGTPYASVEYLGMADASTRWLSFLRGAFDVAFDISRDNWDAVIGPDGALAPDLAARGMRLISEPALESYYLGFNMDDPVVGPNKKLRQAISCAFDSAQWCALNRGRHLASTGPLPPGVDGRLETPHPYAFDLERAKALLAEAGYPGGTDPATGRRLSLRLSLGKSDQETREGAELLAGFLDRIGIALAPDYSTFPQFLRTLNKREEQMFLIGWVADWPDALNFLQLFVSRNASPGPNRVNYANPEYDALFDEASATSDPARRRELVGAMQDIVREDIPWACLYYRREFVLVGPSILGFRLHDFPLGAEKHWRRAPAP